MEAQERESMKPTQQQIEAALRYANDNETVRDTEIIDAIAVPYCQSTLASRFCATSIILAAAYREAMHEIERLKPWADLAISSNALLEIERSKNKQ